MKYNIVISEDAYNDLEEIIRYISSNSQYIETAHKFKKKIIDSIFSLSIFPKRNRIYLISENNIKYRSLIINSYRVIYYIENSNVNIIGIFHTSQNNTN